MLLFDANFLRNLSFGDPTQPGLRPVQLARAYPRGRFPCGSDSIIVLRDISSRDERLVLAAREMSKVAFEFSARCKNVASSYLECQRSSLRVPAHVVNPESWFTRGTAAHDKLVFTIEGLDDFL